MQRLVVGSLAILLGLVSSWFADDVRTETIHFEKRSSSARIEGSFAGYEAVRYLLSAKGGQRMTVDLVNQSGAAYFNIFEPGKVPGNDGAMFIGSTGGSNFEGHRPGALRPLRR